VNAVLIIQHRINDVAGLKSTSTEYGVEIDIRSNQDGLYLAHDPFSLGLPLEVYLQNYEHSLLVLNVKEEGLEVRTKAQLEQFQIENYFFLDQSLPFLIKRGQSGHIDGAARLSEFESLESVRLIAPFCQWVWVDFFKESKLSEGTVSDLHALGLKVCLVSPELHSFARKAEAQRFAKDVLGAGLAVDAVCTKYPQMWERS
tara:strand:+ start:6709 stop:7311 length:603 start_codon:yes stop_codon:yes gene_type:complete